MLLKTKHADDNKYFPLFAHKLVESEKKTIKSTRAGIVLCTENVVKQKDFF